MRRSSRKMGVAKESFWHRIHTVWKALLVIGAIMFAGVAGREYLDRYATKEDLRSHTTFCDTGSKDAHEDVRRLENQVIAVGKDVENTLKEMEHVRADIRDLLAHRLANPVPYPRSRK
jgi:hypothetical protein